MWWEYFFRHLKLMLTKWVWAVQTKDIKLNCVHWLMVFLFPASGYLLLLDAIVRLQRYDQFSFWIIIRQWGEQFFRHLNRCWQNGSEYYRKLNRIFLSCGFMQILFNIFLGGLAVLRSRLNLCKMCMKLLMAPVCEIKWTWI